MEHPTVLVIDDVEAIVEELLTLMALNRIPAVGARDLDGAIQILEREPTVRAISCDVRLDHECGVDIIDRVRESRALNGRQLAYLFVTGDPTKFHAFEHMSGLAVLSKPVQPRVLVDTLKRMLSSTDA